MSPHQKPQEDVVEVSATAVGAIESLTRRVVFAEPTVLTNEHIDAFSSGRPVPGAVDEPKLIGALMGTDNAYARGYEAGRRDMHEAAGWQPIETAPAACGPDDERILVIGGPFAEPQFVLPDGDWWRMRKSQGGRTFTHWMRPLPVPTEPLGGEG